MIVEVKDHHNTSTKRMAEEESAIFLLSSAASCLPLTPPLKRSIDYASMKTPELQLLVYTMLLLPVTYSNITHIFIFIVGESPGSEL